MSEAPTNYDPVVVTGIGMVTPLGLNTQDSWQQLIAGKSGISKYENEHTKIHVAGIIHEFKPEEQLASIITPKKLRRISRAAQFSLAASLESVNNAGLFNDGRFLPNIDPARIGVHIGTGAGGMHHIVDVSNRIKEGGRATVNDTLIVELERVASVVSMQLGTKGPISAPSAACATGNIAITEGYRDIILDDADIALVGGAESSLNYETLEMFRAISALSENSDVFQTSRPFDIKRNGFVMSEGAAVLTLERKSHAIKRGAKLLAEVSGYSNTSDAGGDTDPSGEGAKSAISKALKRAGGLPNEGVVYINAHATSTLLGDRVEAKVLAELFSRDDAAISSTKGQSGHMLGAAGAFESAVCVQSLNEHLIPPTLNLEEPLEEGNTLDFVQNEPRKANVVKTINNAFGFGGINSVVVFSQSV